MQTIVPTIEGSETAPMRPPPRVAILGTRYPDFSIEEAVLADLGVDLVAGDGATAQDIIATAGDAAVVLAGSRPRFDADVLDALAGAGLQGIVRYGIGTDSIDLEAARRAAIAVARVSDYGTEAVAFHAVSMAVSLLRRLPAADRAVRDGSWGVADLRPLHLPSSLTAGVVGYGRIGRQAARCLLGLGFPVCAYDEYAPVDDDGVDAVTLHQLLERSDVVTLHAPGQSDGRPLLDAEAVARMRPGSILVNTARGSLIDEEALVEGLRQGRPGFAALDVFATEPPAVARFAGVTDRVLFSPHMAWYTEESERDMRRKAAAEAARLLRGEPLHDPVV